MKLDFSGLESSAPLYGGSNDLLSDGLSDAPSFDLPVTSDVSFFLTSFLHIYFWFYVDFGSLVKDSEMITCLRDLEFYFHRGLTDQHPKSFWWVKLSVSYI